MATPRAPRWTGAVLLVGIALTGSACDSSGATSAATESPARLGGPPPTPDTPPDEAMDHLEKPIAAHLADRVREAGLTLEYVDCPRWSGSVPAELVCDGYVDGVVGQVDVELSRGAGGAVEYDAWLQEGVLATARLVGRLEDEGYDEVDCGATPAYPARVGLRLVCEVQDAGQTVYVAATVTDSSGKVEIKDY